MPIFISSFQLYYIAGVAHIPFSGLARRFTGGFADGFSGVLLGLFFSWTRAEGLVERYFFPRKGWLAPQLQAAGADQ